MRNYSYIDDGELIIVNSKTPQDVALTATANVVSIVISGLFMRKLTGPLKIVSLISLVVRAFIVIAGNVIAVKKFRDG